MAETSKSGESKAADTKAAAQADEALQEEIHRLRVRIKDLQGQLSAKEGEDESLDEATDIIRDLPGRVVDEASKFVRGYTMAYLEQLRIMGEMWSAVADEVAERNRPSVRTRSERTASGKSRRRYGREFMDRSSPSGLAANLPRDIFTGVASAVDKYLDAPRRVVDRFYEAYRESDETDQTSTKTTG